MNSWNRIKHKFIKKSLWTFELSGEEHRIEAYEDSKRERPCISYDGVSVSEITEVYKHGFETMFDIDGHEFIITEFPVSLKTNYSIYIDGISITSGRSLPEEVLKSELVIAGIILIFGGMLGLAAPFEGLMYGLVYLPLSLASVATAIMFFKKQPQKYMLTLAGTLLLANSISLLGEVQKEGNIDFFSALFFLAASLLSFWIYYRKPPSKAEKLRKSREIRFTEFEEWERKKAQGKFRYILKSSLNYGIIYCLATFSGSILFGYILKSHPVTMDIVMNELKIAGFVSPVAAIGASIIAYIDWNANERKYRGYK